MRQLFYVFAVFLICCTPKEKTYVEITEDYCSQIDRGVFKGWSRYFNLIDDSCNSKTGVLVLEEGDESMIIRAFLSESAEKTIDIQYFIFSGDNVGLISVDYLLRAADRGVSVRLLVDDIMVQANADELLALDAHPNMSIKIYNPTANIGKNMPDKIFSLATNFSGFNQRMHNKTFIVDGNTLITGGRNIADEYFDYDHEYNFRDRDVWLTGHVVQEVSNSFTLFWESDLSVPIEELVHADVTEINATIKFEYLHQYSCDPENFWPEVRERIKETPARVESMLNSGEIVWVDNVTFVSDLPGKVGLDGKSESGGITTDSLISLINGAKKSIYIQSPYLVTTEQGQQVLKNAFDRGVEIHILTNSLASTDNIEAFSGYERDREKLLSLNINIYEFKPDAAIRFKVMTGALQKRMNFTPTFGLHAKSMVVDNKIAVIGTFNLDPRSANLNTECIAIIRDASIASELQNTMKEELNPENAWKISTDFNPDSEAGSWKRVKLWTRAVVPKSIL